MIKSLRFAFRLVCAAILLMAVIQVASVRAETPSAPKTEGEIAKELEQKRAEVEEKEQRLAEEEKRIREREKELDKKIKEMERLRDAVSGELEGQRKSNEERVTKMVTVLETMTPKSASAVLETMDDWLAVEVLKRINVTKMAKIMNIMDKSRSAKLSELLTGFYRPEHAKAGGASGGSRQISSVKSPVAGQAEAAKPPATPVAAPPPAQEAVSPATPQKAANTDRGEPTKGGNL